MKATRSFVVFGAIGTALTLLVGYGMLGAVLAGFTIFAFFIWMWNDFE